MFYVTKYFKVIGPHWRVWWDKACIHSSPDSPADMGLACEINVDLGQHWINRLFLSFTQMGLETLLSPCRSLVSGRL